MNWDGVVTISIILGLIFIIYTRIKNQTLRQTYEEVRDLIKPKEA